MSKCIIDCDFHSHTGFSDDCDIPIDTMIEGAIDKRIKILAITDHYDPGYPDPEFPFIPDFVEYHKALDRVPSQYADRIDIRKGIEIGILEGHFDEGRKAAAEYPYDFIIGSFHCTSKDDMYRYDFESSDGQSELEEFYRYMLRCLKEYKTYDILGHLTVLDRYIGGIYDHSPIDDVMDEILRTIISDGKGLEINSSSFRYVTGEWMPRESVLKRYLELGGEILTFGSDAHSPDLYQDHFNECVEFAKQLGFKNYCTFKNRQPEFHKLP